MPTMAITQKMATVRSGRCVSLSLKISSGVDDSVHVPRVLNACAMSIECICSLPTLDVSQAMLSKGAPLVKNLPGHSPGTLPWASARELKEWVDAGAPSACASLLSTPTSLQESNFDMNTARLIFSELQRLTSCADLHARSLRAHEDNRLVEAASLASLSRSMGLQTRSGAADYVEAQVCCARH